MKQFKTYQKIFVIIIPVFFGWACGVFDSDPDDGSRVRVQESFLYKYTTESLNTFDLTGVNGNIKVNGVAELDSVQIWGEKIVESNSREDARAHLSELEVVTVQEGQNLVTVSEHPTEESTRTYIVNYNIEVPLDWDIVLANINGNLELHSLRADKQIILVNGNIEVEDVDDNLQIQLTNGNVTGSVSDITEGMVNINLTNGTMTLGLAKESSSKFSASVVNGSVSVQNLPLTNLQTGDTFVSGVLGNGTGDIILKSVNGNITVNGY